MCGATLPCHSSTHLRSVDDVLPVAAYHEETTVTVVLQTLRVQLGRAQVLPTTNETSNRRDRRTGSEKLSFSLEVWLVCTGWALLSVFSGAHAVLLAYAFFPYTKKKIKKYVIYKCGAYPAKFSQCSRCDEIFDYKQGGVPRFSLPKKTSGLQGFFFK